MQFLVEPTACGFTVAIGGEHYQAEPCEFRYPQAVWQAYPAKEALIRELAFISTMATPLILRHPNAVYDTPSPLYFDTYRSLFERAIPNLVEPIADESATEIRQLLQATHYTFGTERPTPALQHGEWSPRRAVLPLSFGKDSLLSLATLRELGYEVFPVSIDERVLPRANALHRQLAVQLHNEFGLHTDVLENEVQLFSDYQILERPETRLYQVQVHFIYALAMLPFSYHYRAPLIVLSNELPNALATPHRDGSLAPKRYMQGPEANLAMDTLVRALSGGQVRVANPIGALGNFAIYRLLHGHFPQFGRYQVSCHLEVTDHQRWCHGCERCSHGYLYLTALGLNPREFGFEHTLLDGRNDRFFVAAQEEPGGSDIYRQFVREEEWLAGCMARDSGYEYPRWVPDEALPAEVTAHVFGLHVPARHPLEQQAQQLFRRLLG